MTAGNTESWKSKYINWYRYLKPVFGNDVPPLTDVEIMDYVSDKDWIIVPISGEKNKKDARLAQRPNLWFDLSDEGKISFGIVYDKLDSITRLRSILSSFNENERNRMIEKLAILDDSFHTIVYRKIKRHHWAESPSYEESFVQQSNQMDYEQFVKLFDVVDKIMNERNLLEKGKKYQLAPSIDIVSSEIRREENDFKEKLSKIRPIYEISVKVRTKEEIEKEQTVQKEMGKKRKQEAFHKFVGELDEKRRQNLISAEEYRRLAREYRKRAQD